MSKWTDPVILEARERDGWDRRSLGAVVKAIKRIEAMERNARTVPERRRAYRRNQEATRV